MGLRRSASDSNDYDGYHSNQASLPVNQPPPIVLSFEGFSPAALGCYGSSWNQTPVIDSIAAAGIVWDRCIATSDLSESIFRQFASCLFPDPASPESSAELLTDVSAVVDRTDQTPFARIDLIPTDQPELAATEIVQTELAELVAAATERLSDRSHGKPLWIHSGCLTQCWDAPRDLEWIDDLSELDEDNRWAPDEDPIPAAETLVDAPPQTFPMTAPPQVQLSGAEHPDFVTSWMRTYGCQIQLIDTLAGTILDSIDGPPRPLILMGTSGFRLGQGGWIGSGLGPLRSRDVHLPLIFAPAVPVAHDRFAGLRFPKLASSSSVALAIETALQEIRAAEARGGSLSLDQAATESLEIHSARASANRMTEDWFFVRDPDETEHLYSKPDDVEDFNDVARVRPDIVATMDRA